VKMVVGTKPGTSVPVKVLRNKQEKNAEPHRRRTGSRGRAAEAAAAARQDRVRNRTTPRARAALA
jgi:hypothetical protein